MTSINNRPYIGWFGIIFVPIILATTIRFIIAFIAAPPVNIDSIYESIAASLFGFYFYPISYLGSRLP